MIFRSDGTARIKVIQPGQGSSGYYPADVLKRDGPQIFKRGTKCFVNHQTAAEESARPEGSLHDLAGVLTSDARFEENGASGPGLYADLRVFKAFRPMVEELAPHIGVSIRANGKIGEATIDGKKTRVVEKLTHGKSIDLVTSAGAGGRFCELLESARTEIEKHPAEQELEQVLKETEQQTPGEQVIKEQTAAPSREKEKNVAENDTAVTVELEAKLREAEAHKEALLAEKARLHRDLIMREAREIATEFLSHERLPQVAKEKILYEALLDVPMTENSLLDTPKFKRSLRDKTASEHSYMIALTGGVVRGMGASSVVVKEASVQDHLNGLKETYMRMGMSEAAAKAAAGVN